MTQRRTGVTSDPVDDARSRAVRRVLRALGRRARRLSPTSLMAAGASAIGAASRRWSAPSLAARSLRARGDA